MWVFELDPSLRVYSGYDMREDEARRAEVHYTSMSKSPRRRSIPPARPPSLYPLLLTRSFQHRTVTSRGTASKSAFEGTDGRTDGRVAVGSGVRSRASSYWAGRASRLAAAPQGVQEIPFVRRRPGIHASCLPNHDISKVLAYLSWYNITLEIV